MYKQDLSIFGRKPLQGPSYIKYRSYIFSFNLTPKMDPKSPDDMVVSISGTVHSVYYLEGRV